MFSVHDAFLLNQQVDVVYTDFTKVFDSIDHGILIYILDRLGIGDPLLTWLRSYLSECVQFISVFGRKSKVFQVLWCSSR